MNVVGLVEMIKMKISLKMVRSTYSTFPLFLLISCIFFFNHTVLTWAVFNIKATNKIDKNKKESKNM